MNSSGVKRSMPDDILEVVGATVEVLRERPTQAYDPNNAVGEALPDNEADYDNPLNDVRSVKLKEGERFLSEAEARERRKQIREQQENAQQ